MSKPNRPLVSERCVDNAHLSVREMLRLRLGQKGFGTFSSSHEIYGILAEEYGELLSALRGNDLVQFKHELIDIAVGAEFGIACIDSGLLDGVQL